MHSLDTRSEGNIHISDRALAKIASHAVQKSKEVLELADGKIRRTDKKKFYKAIGLKIEEAGAIIQIAPIVTFETPLQQLAKFIQFNVKQEVEKWTGIRVLEVNIGIAGIVQRT